MSAQSRTGERDGDRDEVRGMTAYEGRVLLAEDDPDMRAVVADVLLADGYDVVEVASGKEMLQALSAGPASMSPDDAFEVIVTDHRMPNGNGLDAVERLRHMGCSTPVLLVTAFADERLRRRADELEAMLMFKPVPVEAFRAAVSVLLSIAHRAGAARGAGDA